MNANKNAPNQNSKNATSRITLAKTATEPRTQQVVNSQLHSVKPKKLPDNARSTNLMDSTDKLKLT